MPVGSGTTSTKGPPAARKLQHRTCAAATLPAGVPVCRTKRASFCWLSARLAARQAGCSCLVGSPQEGKDGLAHHQLVISAGHFEVLLQQKRFRYGVAG